MLTSEIVDELIVLHNGWNRDGDHGVLRYFNMANSLLASVDAEERVLYDGGELPALTTVAGTFLYSMPSTVRKVEAMLVKASEVAPRSDYGMRSRMSLKNSVIVGGIQYAQVPYIKTTQGGAVQATVRFTLDPGDTTDYYRYLAYKSPTAILSESIQHDILQPYDIEYLIPAASIIIAGVQNYTLLEALQVVRKTIIPEYAKVLSKGDQGAWDTDPVDRGF